MIRNEIAAIFLKRLKFNKCKPFTKIRYCRNLDLSIYLEGQIYFVKYFFLIRQHYQLVQGMNLR